MKKWFVLLMTLVMALPLCALADESRITANGTVESDTTYQLIAPYSGVLTAFDWDNGDRVEKGETLFTMDTFKVYAPADGTVRALFAREGDLAADIVSQYGCLGVMERTLPQTITASTTGAYNDADNRLIHVGETVYFEQNTDKDNQGEGRVVSVDGSNSVVEVTAGDFEIDDGVKLYRDEKRGTKTAIGTGTVRRADDLTFTGTGRVLRCAVKEGDKVEKGQLLYELAGQDAQMDAQAALTAPADGALEVLTTSGQQVYRGQLLGKVHGLSAFHVVAQVDEVDLDRVHVGDSLTVELDRYPDTEVTGIVTEIAGLGVEKQNATYYDVTLSLSTTLELLPGMNATVRLN